VEWLQISLNMIAQMPFGARRAAKVIAPTLVVWPRYIIMVARRLWHLRDSCMDWHPAQRLLERPDVSEGTIL